MKNFLILLTVLPIFLTPLTSTARGERLPNYGEMELYGYDHMMKIVREAVYEAKSYFENIESEEAEREAVEKSVEKLRKTLFYILARPDKDNMVAKLTPDLRRELNTHNSYLDTMESIIDEARSGVMSENRTVRERATYLFILENALAELKPSIRDNNQAKKIFVKLADQKMKIPEAITKERRMGGMYETRSPSEVALEALQKYFPKEYPKETKRWWQFWK